MGEEYVLVCVSEEEYVEFPAGKQAEIMLDNFACKIVAGFVMRNSLGYGSENEYAFVSKDTFYNKGLDKKFRNATADVIEFLIESGYLDIKKLCVFDVGWIYKKFEEAGMLDELKEILSRKEGEK